MKKLVYLGLSILDISKIVMYEYWCDYAKLKHGDNAKLCSHRFGHFIVYIKSEDTYADLAGDLEKRFET